MDRQNEILGVCATRLPREGRRLIHKTFQLIFWKMNHERKCGVAFVLKLLIKGGLRKKTENSILDCKLPLTPVEIRNDKIVVWDLNAHVGRLRNNIENVIDAHGMRERNNEEKSLIDFCECNNFAVMDTFNQHRESHKHSCYRWNSTVGDYTEESITDLLFTTK